MLPDLLDPRGFHPLLGDGLRRRELHRSTLDRKYAACHPAFVAELVETGIHIPVAVEWDDINGWWALTDGHHRWAVAERHGLLVPWVSHWRHASDGRLMQSQSGKPDCP